MLRIDLGPGRVVLIDKADALLIISHTWSVRSTGYAATNVRDPRTKRGGIMYMHRLITGAEAGTQVDHINRNRLDNRRCNLRTCTIQENRWNTARSRAGVSKYTGVYLDRRTGRWIANISVRNRHVHIGVFDSESEAARARDAVAKRERGEFASLNFPE